MTDSPGRGSTCTRFETALEVRAEPDGRGGWHVRSERATGVPARC